MERKISCDQNSLFYEEENGEKKFLYHKIIQVENYLLLTLVITRN